MKLQLPDVTLVMIETREHQLARLAIEDCLDAADFGDVIIFTDTLVPFVDGHTFRTMRQQEVRLVSVEDWPTKEGWSQFLWNEVGAYVRTSYLLSIQWDSWIVNPAAWTNDFLRYDYIGAPWWYKDGMNVGNGGFSLRSTALQRYIAKHRDCFPCINAVDDDLLCRKYRPALMDRGFEWASEPFAHRFAFECMPPVGPTFGFHGIFNWPKVLPEDRLRERIEIAKRSKYITGNPQMWGQLLKVYPDAASG